MGWTSGAAKGPSGCAEMSTKFKEEREERGRRHSNTKLGNLGIDKVLIDV
jgi:hypothetical protein